MHGKTYGLQKNYLWKVGNKVSLSEVYSSFASLALKEGKEEEALSFAQKANEFAEETKAKKEQIVSLRVLGVASSSIENLIKSVKLAEETNLTLEYAKSSYELGRLLKTLGNSTAAERYLARAKEIFKQANAHFRIKKLDELAGMK